MVTDSSPQSVTLPSYQLRLPGYEGPLDVLLRLVERNRLEIAEVSLVAVTSQFLSYIDDMPEAPQSVVAAFTTVGTRLTVLKSRSLLPRPTKQNDDDEPSDLTRQLLEYRLARQASQFLQIRDQQDLRSYGRTTPVAVHVDLKRASERLASYPASVLVQAIRRRLMIAPTPTRMIPQRRMVSLRQTVNRILDVTGRGRRVAFAEVVQHYVSRTEVATAFLGMLVLVRRNAIVVDQAVTFGEISLHGNEMWSGSGGANERFDSTD